MEQSTVPSLSLYRITKAALITTFTTAAVVCGSLRVEAQQNSTTFRLTPDPAVISCLGDRGLVPEATVQVLRGNLNDTLVINASHIRPGLKFDMFTVQRSKLLANGTVDPAFKNVFKGSFGEAWYQSDLQADSNGRISATIKTILLDQIFGFDPDVNLPPTNTFHVGFWFNNPEDANTNGCTFNVAKPTPFNGEHRAGPVAMITTPDATTGLGPLCTNPNTNTNPVSCNP